MRKRLSCLTHLKGRKRCFLPLLHYWTLSSFDFPFEGGPWTLGFLHHIEYRAYRSLLHLVILHFMLPLWGVQKTYYNNYITFSSQLPIITTQTVASLVRIQMLGPFTGFATHKWLNSWTTSTPGPGQLRPQSRTVPSRWDDTPNQPSDVSPTDAKNSPKDDRRDTTFVPDAYVELPHRTGNTPASGVSLEMPPPYLKGKVSYLH